MGYKTVVFIQLLVALVAISHDGPNNLSSVVSPFHLFKSRVRHLLEKTLSKKVLENRALESLKNLSIKANLVNTETPDIFSSINDASEDLDLSSFKQLYFSSFRSGCACRPRGNDSSCSTQCTSLESRCGRTCVHVTEYLASRIVRPVQRDDENDGLGFENVFSTYQTTLSTECDLLTRGCILTTAVIGAAIAAAVGVGVAVGVGAGANGQALSNTAQQQQEMQVTQNVQRFLLSGGLFNAQIPRNDQPIPVRGTSFFDGGCGDNLVQFPDGKCYPVLRRGPCGDPFRWVTVDPKNLTGRCSPRLCGRGRVFVGRDGLCHDVNDPLECRGGRRLYYTAYGDPLCDCPVGQYPFPNEDNDCVPLFTRGPCKEGQVVGFEISGALACVPADCPSRPTEQLVINENGQCFSLGSRDPCSSASQFYGYDVFQKRGVCIDTSEKDSPYFSGEEQQLGEFYNQIYPEYDYYRFILTTYSFERMQKARRRQDVGGVFRFSISAPETLLNPCRPGERNGNNYKCSNPLVPRKRRSGLLQAVRSAFRCPAGNVLRANGFCVNDTVSTSCGPSYQFISATGQCRQVATR